MAKSKKRKAEHSSTTQKDARRPHKSVKTSPKSAPKQLDPVIPFDAEDRILLVGEGDFSFAKSIVEHHGCCDVTATCFDAKSELFEKYIPQAEEHVSYLGGEGQTVLYGVDATKLEATKALKKPYDRIIFNFPHVGGKTKDVNRQVRFNQELLVKFFASAKQLLENRSGTIIVTLFEGEPYTLWNIKDLARHSELEVVRSFRFSSEAYPGYSHARTLGNIEGGGGWKGEEREARSFVFRIKGGEAVAPKKNRKKVDEDSEDGD